jgi:RNA polymerase sigma-70 factor, ECF subfamily
VVKKPDPTYDSQVTNMARDTKISPGGGTESAELELCRHMEAYLEGRIEAFDALYAALAARVRRFQLSLCRDASLADDLTQETFLQMHRSRRTYEPGRPVTPWVFAIARHVYLMHRRATARRLRFEATVAADARSDETMHDAARALGDADEVRHALRDVPPDQRQALLMHHVHGWSFSEIATRLGIRVNAAKTRAFRGMRRLKGHLR